MAAVAELQLKTEPTRYDNSGKGSKIVSGHIDSSSIRLVPKRDGSSMVYITQDSEKAKCSVVRPTNVEPYSDTWHRKPCSKQLYSLPEKKHPIVEAFHHRMNERKRHKKTNDLINLCVASIPISVDNKETKVMLLQRVVAYFCFLEDKIESLCTLLGVDSAGFQTSNVLGNTGSSAEVWSRVQNLDLADFQPVELLNGYLEELGYEPISELLEGAVCHLNSRDADEILANGHESVDSALVGTANNRTVKRLRDEQDVTSSTAKRQKLSAPRIVCSAIQESEDMQSPLLEIEGMEELVDFPDSQLGGYMLHQLDLDFLVDEQLVCAPDVRLTTPMDFSNPDPSSFLDFHCVPDLHRS